MRWESSRKYITYTTPDGLKCRDNKLHEEKYCKEAMEHEFRIRAEFAKRKFHRAEEPMAELKRMNRPNSTPQPQPIQPL